MDLKEELKIFIHKKLEGKNNQVNHETKLFEEKILDSILILDLMGFIENKINRKLTDDEILMSHFESIDSISKKFFENE